MEAYPEKWTVHRIMRVQLFLNNTEISPCGMPEQKVTCLFNFSTSSKNCGS